MSDIEDPFVLVFWGRALTSALKTEINIKGNTTKCSVASPFCFMLDLVICLSFPLLHSSFVSSPTPHYRRPPRPERRQAPRPQPPHPLPARKIYARLPD